MPARRSTATSTSQSSADAMWGGAAPAAPPRVVSAIARTTRRGRVRDRGPVPCRWRPRRSERETASWGRAGPALNTRVRRRRARDPTANPPLRTSQRALRSAMGDDPQLRARDRRGNHSGCKMGDSPGAGWGLALVVRRCACRDHAGVSTRFADARVADPPASLDRLRAEAPPAARKGVRLAG